MKVKYKDGYKYQLDKDFTYETKIKLSKRIVTDYIKMNRTGKLTIKKGYAWDGASGLALDTNDFMRGSLVHDALYQLKRSGFDEIKRIHADDLLVKICKKDGMSKVRAWYVYKAVRLFAAKYATASQKKPIRTAP